jgi:hypothetical protein
MQQLVRIKDDSTSPVNHGAEFLRGVIGSRDHKRGTHGSYHFFYSLEVHCGPHHMYLRRWRQIFCFRNSIAAPHFTSPSMLPPFAFHRRPSMPFVCMMCLHRSSACIDTLRSSCKPFPSLLPWSGSGLKGCVVNSGFSGIFF